ncbi:MAG: organic solvent tolerance protein OstA [Enterovirga sp.]|nr:organic solvent tolerance protein OstA [Enterovirga sp.]
MVRIVARVAAAGLFAVAPALARADTPTAPAGAADLRVAQAPAAKPPAGRARDRSSAFGELGSNREPIKIDADRLDVFDKEGRAVFGGNVVAVQGDSTMRCSLLTVLYEAGRGAGSAGGSPISGADSGIRKLTCKGPVTIVSKTQVATGDNAEFDRTKNKVYLTGNAALSDGPNVTRGERVAYDLNTGIANVEGGRVRALIVPGSQDKNAAPGGASKTR